MTITQPTYPVTTTNLVTHVGAYTDTQVALGTPNTQTGATYTLVAADVRKVVEGNSASAQTFTVPSMAVGDEIVLRQMGAGQITVAAGAGVTLRARGGALKLAGQYAEATLTWRTTTEAVLSGDTVV